MEKTPRLFVAVRFVAIIVLLFLVATGSTKGGAGVVTIASVSPTSGDVGSSVTIRGGNFNPARDHNIVHFGSVRAIVTSASPAMLRVIVPPGTTFAPVTVTTNGFTASSSSPFIVTFDDGGSVVPLHFSPNVDYPASVTPWGTAIADFDDDGKPDIAETNWGDGVVRVFRNTCVSGSITPASFATHIDLPGLLGSCSLATGDIDGDGKLDLVVGDGTGSRIFVFRNTSTNGVITFAPGVSYETGTNPAYVAIGDLDGDGKPDMAIVNWNSNSVSVFRNMSTTGSISFAPKVDFTTGINPWGLAMGDLDGDGKLDLAVTNQHGNSVSLLRNMCVPGTITPGSFAAKVDFATTDISDPNGPNAVRIADLDGDGKPDVIVSSWIGIISVFRNACARGSITSSSFAAKVDFSGAYSNVAVADIDGDGKLDLVASTWNNAAGVFRNTGSTGGITVSSFAPVVEFATGPLPHALALGDLDGDGKPDIAVPNMNGNSVSVLRNTIEYIDIASVCPTSGNVGSCVTIRGKNFNPARDQNIVYFGSVRAIVTNASPTMLFVRVPTGATLAPITVTVNGFTAYSKSPFIVTFEGGGNIVPVSFSANVDFPATSSPWGTAIADLDNDGKPDFAVTNSGDGRVQVFRNMCVSGSTTSGSFAPPIELSAGTSAAGIAAVDIDGDGKLDLVIGGGYGSSISVFRNTSTSGAISFAPGVTYETGLYPAVVAVGDLDGDGKTDMAIVNWGSNTVSVFRNTSSIGSVSFAPRVDFTTGTNPWGLAIGDLDGDGKLDLAVTNQHSNTVSILRNTCTCGTITPGSFAAKVDFATTDISDPGGPNAVRIADLDGDGKPDVIVSSWIGIVSVFRNMCTRGSITSSSFAAKVDFSGAQSNVAVADVDGDGKLDLIAGAWSNSVEVFRNTGCIGGITVNSFAPPVGFAAGVYPHSLSLGDLDGDGKPEIVSPNINSNSVSLLRNNIEAINVFPCQSVCSIIPTSKTPIPVGIISSIGFDATSVDISSVRFGPGGAQAIPGKVSKLDLNHDGKLDLVLTFSTNETGIKPRDASATMTGLTSGGQQFVGTDAIRTCQMGRGLAEQEVIEQSREDGSPKEYRLERNFPNPFNPSTVIRYSLPASAIVRLTIYNSLGQIVAEPVNGNQEAGYHEVRFDGSGLASGAYFYRIQAGSYTAMMKMLLVK